MTHNFKIGQEILFWYYDKSRFDNEHKLGGHIRILDEFDLTSETFINGFYSCSGNWWCQILEVYYD